MKMRIGVFAFVFCLLFAIASLLSPNARAQQTLGGITGTVTDASGAVVAGATVTLVGDETKLTRSVNSSSTGSYDFVNLPIGAYTLTFTQAGFQSLTIPSILVQANRTATVNAALQVGNISESITVEETPLMNIVDTTNGYVMDKAEIEAVPLSTGSFTGLAILSPGVNAELSGGTGANSGLGNAPIWANGQRDTSNTLLLNGVDASNLFNGKTTSQVASARVVNNTGVSGAASTSSAVIQSSASPYLAIGQSIPTPAPETIQEVRVNTSMYDAQQGSTSGAHIDMSTVSGTNNFHGMGYVHRGTDWINSAPYFFNLDPNIPADQKVPELHRYSAGGTFGGPIKKDKLFGYVAYQHMHVSDQEIGLSRVTVPHGLGPVSTRTPQNLAALAQTDFGNTINPVVDQTPGDISPVAYKLLTTVLPNGQPLIPADDGQTPTVDFPENAIIPGTAYFLADQVVSNLDWNISSKDTLSLKYYYQHDPTIAPYAYSSLAGFAQHLDAGSQVASITNTQTITSNLSLVEVFGFIREKMYSTISQPFSPASVGIDTFGSNVFPGITIVDDFGNEGDYNTGCANSDKTCIPYDNPVSNAALTIGQGGASMGAFTGVFQNRFNPSADAIWIHGKHTVTFGGSFSYTQLNVRNNRAGDGMIGTPDFSTFLAGQVTPYTADGFVTTNYLVGNTNRYYRTKEVGTYVQDKFQFRSNLSLTFGVRWDYHGGMTEKYGRLFNFDPTKYTDSDPAAAFIVAGNNPQFPSSGVSSSTLTGRQWGFAPRIGLAWSPKMFKDKVVVRAGWGMYYDRGELYSYLSPGFSIGVTNGGPFGVSQTPPYVTAQECSSASISVYYDGYIPICDQASAATGTGGSLSYPWGAMRQTAPNGNPASIGQYLPNAAAIAAQAPLFSFADYNRGNKLPYTMNQTLDIQWQPRNDLAIDIGYVGNLGRHGVVPIPFNQAGIASPSHPIHGQNYTYGYTVQGPAGCTLYVTCSNATLPDGTPYLNTYEGGNVDLRVPYLGYSSESESYVAEGISAYHALQFHVEKRMSHGIQVAFSYTYSHSTDEQSDLGLFFNGNNPLNLRSAYGSSDFDRTHVFNISYLYQFPKFYSDSTFKGKLADGWGIEGTVIFESGQPFSVIDYTGAVGSIFYGVNNGITNPIVPLATGANGCTPKQAVTGANGVNGQYALSATCFSVPLLNPGDLGGAIANCASVSPQPAGCASDSFETNFTTGQRNIFRQFWQSRGDISVVKDTKLTERFDLKYSFDVYNLTNTPSFDLPIDNVSQNQYYNNVPVQGQQVLPTNCGQSGQTSGFFNCPFGLGSVNKTIGAARQIQMSLALRF